MNKKHIEKFLKEANKSTYANKSAPKVKSSLQESFDYEYVKGNLKYHDTYFGERDFIGVEVIYKDNKVIWGSNYFGYILDKKIDKDFVYDFLRESLMKESSDILPIRGPKKYINGKLTYSFKVQGDISRFSGKEEIFLNKKCVYSCILNGGEVY